MRRKDEIILWPVYFDSLRTRREGRRLPKNLCAPSPSLTMIERALKNLGLEYEVFPEPVYPRLPWIKMGFVIVKKSGRKGRILKDVAVELRKIST